MADRRGIAWVVEADDWGEEGPPRTYALGLFHAVIEPYGDSPGELLPIDQALAWARERTPRVLVRVFDDQLNYSGGAQHLIRDGETLPIWDESRTLSRRLLPDQFPAD